MDNSGASGNHTDIYIKELIIEKLNNGVCVLRERVGRRMSEVWKNFYEIIYTDTAKYTGYAKCKKCPSVIESNHKTGTNAMKKHVRKDERMHLQQINNQCKDLIRHVIAEVVKQERDEMFKKKLNKYYDEIKRVEPLIKEANRMAIEIGNSTEFKLKRKIPSVKSSHNRNTEAIGNRISIMVIRNNTVTQKWSVQLFESKLTVMRDFYREWKFNETNDQSDDNNTVKRAKIDSSPLINPFDPESFEGTQQIEHSEPKQKSQSQMPRFIVRFANTK